MAGGLLSLALCAVRPASAVPIRGQVLSAEGGRPLRGAEVLLIPIPSLLTPEGDPSPAKAENALARDATDARGDFILDAPGPGIWRLHLAAPGHRAVTCDLLPLLDALDVPPVSLMSATPSDNREETTAAVPPRVRCRVAEAAPAKRPAAPPGQTLEVRLLAPDGKPAAGAWAVLPDGGLYGPSGTDGRLQLPLPGSAAPEARFWNADGAWAAVLLRPDSRLLIRLRPAATLAGTVVDRATRRPLPQALVWPAADPGRITRTDAQGRFTLRVPFLTAPALQAAATGYQVAAIRSDRPADGLTVRLAPAAAVAGVAVDQTGRPVAGAEVEVVPTEIALPAGEVSGWSRTDPSGRFHFDGLKPGERLTVRVRASGFAALESPVPPLASDPATALRLILQRGRTVLGRVVDAAGRPVPEAEVLAFPIDPAAPLEAFLRAKARTMRRRTGRDGAFSFAAVGAGQLDLSLRAAGAAPKWLRGIEVPPGSAPLDLGRIVLGPDSGLRGTVVDDAGAPIAGARVTAVPVAALPRPGGIADGPPPASRTDAAGRFALNGLEAGVKLLLRAEQDGFLPATLEVASANGPEDDLAPIVLELRPATALRGTVVDEDANPVEGARIVLLTQQTMAGDRLRPLGVATSDRLGAFSLAAVPPGAHRLAVQAAGYLARSQPLTVDPESPVRPVEVRLARGAELSGRVVSERGQPVEGAEVSLSSGPEEDRMMGLAVPAAISDAEGAYRLEGLSAGAQQIQVLHQDYLPERRQLQIDAAGTAQDFTLRGGAELAGQVVDDESEPVVGATISLRAEQEPVAVPQRWTDADGHFRVPGLMPARYTVLVELPGYAPTEVSGVDARQGAPDLLVRLTRGATLFGQIHGLPADERTRLQVWANGPAGAQLPGTVDAEGSYRIQNLGAGPWRISARAEGLGREVSAPLDLAPDQREAFLDFEFAAGYALAGVVTCGGSPVEGALVSVQGLAGEVAGAMTGAQGLFRVAPLAPGTYRVAVLERATGAQGSWTLDLAEDLEVTFDLPAAEEGGRR